jgi:hypothetical protein
MVARLRELDPMLGISNLKNLIPFRGADDFDRWAGGLEKAGLPD